MTGIEYGAKVVSLISAIKMHAGVSLVEARQMVERVIDGESASIPFQDEGSLRVFKEVAEGLGARVQ